MLLFFNHPELMWPIGGGGIGAVLIVARTWWRHGDPFNQEVVGEQTPAAVTPPLMLPRLGSGIRCQSGPVWGSMSLAEDQAAAAYDPETMGGWQSGACQDWQPPGWPDIDLPVPAAPLEPLPPDEWTPAELAELRDAPISFPEPPLRGSRIADTSDIAAAHMLAEVSDACREQDEQAAGFLAQFTIAAEMYRVAVRQALT